MPSLEKRITELKTSFHKALTDASSEQLLETVRLTYLSRQGLLAQLMDSLKTLSPADKKTWGPVFNTLKQEMTAAFEEKKQALATKQHHQTQARQSSFDVTAYKPYVPRGTLHPYSHVIERIENVFISMGFTIADGPEVETDFYNFKALNIPDDHPARDMYDTFWLDVPGLLMRTHTSTIQIHAMEKATPPIALVASGRAYRHEATDASHDFMFMQTEGMVIDKNISMAHLFATVQAMLSALFERKLTLRVRPGYFPFVEPGVEIDISCPFCSKGCSVCKKTGWVETAGAGLIHPNVLKACSIDADIYSGFAFGFGLTRLAMLVYGINDIRLLHSGRLEFLQQF